MYTAGNNILTSLFCNPLQYRELIWQLTKREVVGRYRGSALGLLWSFFNPIFMLTVYTFFFSMIYQTRGLTNNINHLDFAINLFAGLIPFNMFSECVNRAPQLVVNNVNYVKKVIFPLAILPWVNMGSALFHAAISVFVLFTFFIYIHHSLPWTVIFLPLVNLPLMLLILGLSWFLASVGVFLRDVAHSISMFTLALMFLSPVFYTVNAIPEHYRAYIYLNPLTTIIEENRTILIAGQMPNWHAWTISMLLGLIIAFLGYFWFEKTRFAFADVV